MSCNCESQQVQAVYDDRTFLPGVPSAPGQPGPLFPGPGPSFPPGFPGPSFPPGQTGTPPQLSQAHLASILGQHQRPVGGPPAQMVFLYNMLKSNPFLLQTLITQQPQSLQQAVQFASLGTSVPRETDERVLPGFCYYRWSLVFTFNDVFLMWPVTNLFGFVVGYCYPYFNPCIIPDFHILFALC